MRRVPRREGRDTSEDWYGTRSDAGRQSSTAAEPSRTCAFNWALITIHCARPRKDRLTASSNGSEKLTHPLQWALGRGDFGQTYVYSDSGKFYESHLSFYTKIDKLDITPGHVRSLPASIDVAAGRVMSPREAQECLGCHTTAATVANEFDPEHAMMGITCEACHGPGRNHVAG